MATFYFDCPFCKKKIKADTEWIGQSAECPYCSNMLVINKPQNTSKKTQLLPKLSVADTGKKDEQLKIINCPDCNKEMSARAEVCPHCGAPNETLPLRKSKILYVLLGWGLGTFGVHNMYANRSQAWWQFMIALFSITMSIAAIHSNNSDVLVLPTLGFTVCGIWALCDICSVEKDGNGVPFK